ncbi:MAG: AlpA family transcriptional regulator [Porticoccaceae bacterium]|nr:AlpA family transcriptional regulator [Pseudomonadales bacterium]
MTTNTHKPAPQQPDKTLHSDRLIRWPEVHEITGLCRSHVHQLAAKTPPQFPRPRKLVPGGRASAWVESEIREWVQQRIEQANGSEVA